MQHAHHMLETVKQTICVGKQCRCDTASDGVEFSKGAQSNSGVSVTTGLRHLQSWMLSVHSHHALREMFAGAVSSVVYPEYRFQ